MFHRVEPKCVNNLIIIHVIYLSDTFINIDSLINLCLSTRFTQISVNKLTGVLRYQFVIRHRIPINLRFMFESK